MKTIRIKDRKVSSSCKIVRLCHKCLTVQESVQELKKCKDCGIKFQPLNSHLIDADCSKEDYKSHYLPATELHEEDLVKGIFVLW